jgi:endonuclease/exonuclease/phosphatase family metal-dependent hydrolase
MPAFRRLLLPLLFLPAGLAAQTTLKVMHYNLLAFGLPCQGVSVTDKYAWLGSILNHYRPDIFTVNEIAPVSTYSEGIRQLSFAYTTQVAYPPLSNEASSDRVNQLFYNTALLAYGGMEIVSGGFRDINAYRLYVKAETQPGDTAWLYCVVAHLKAGIGEADQQTRASEALAVMNWMSSRGRGKDLLFMGDLNIAFSAEDAFQTLALNADTSIRLRDPLGLENGWAGQNNAQHFTQSTRTASSDCGSDGGMDDRLDFILLSPSIRNQQGRFSLVPGSYKAYGNDGAAFNQQLNCAGNTTVPAQVCANLRLMSDHLPVVLQLQSSGRSSLLPEAIPGFRYELPGQPFSGSLHFRWTSERPGAFLLEMCDLQGRSLARLQLQGSAGEAILPAKRLPSGLYLLRVRDEAGRQLSLKVWKR